MAWCWLTNNITLFTLIKKGIGRVDIVAILIEDHLTTVPNPDNHTESHDQYGNFSVFLESKCCISILQFIIWY